MQIDAVIPARMGSTRYPGKPLCDIHGLTMIEHVYRRTEMSESVDNTYVATPNEEIHKEVESFGGEAIMTGSHPRATDRVAEVAEDLDSDIVIVMQGDEPLVHPEMIDNAVEPIIKNNHVRCTNLVKSIETEESFRDPNNVKVVIDDNRDALYFSREPIPNLHDAEFDEIDAYKQVCVIPFEREFLFNFTSMEETILEKIESIDMLRLLENGYDVRLAETERDVYAVDTVGDHKRVNKIMTEDPLFEKYS